MIQIWPSPGEAAWENKPHPGGPGRTKGGLGRTNPFQGALGEQRVDLEEQTPPRGDPVRTNPFQGGPGGWVLMLK